MPVPRDGESLCPTGAVVLRGRRGVLNRHGLRSTWSVGLCTWCGKTVPKGRRTLWCSQWCVDAYQATQPEHQRAAVKARDGGVCSLCGLDTERLRRAARRYWSTGPWRTTPARRHKLGELLTFLGWATSAHVVQHLVGQRASWWDMDHRVPIADGGHPYALTNLRTLCYWCHKDETSEAATRRAEARRGVKASPDPHQVPLFGAA